MESCFEILESVVGSGGSWTEIDINAPVIYKHNFNEHKYVVDEVMYLLIVSNNDKCPFELYLGIYNYVLNHLDGFIPVLYVPLHFYDKVVGVEDISFITSKTKYRLFNDININIPIRDYGYTPITQLVVKYILFEEYFGFSTRSIATFLNVSNTSIMRAFDFLVSIEAIKKEGTSTSNVKYCALTKKQFFNKVEPYFLKPYRRYIYTPINKNNYIHKLRSGDSALELYTDLEAEDINTYAVNKKTFEEILKDKRINKNGGYSTFQEFIYEPDLFNKDGVTIDKLDAYIISKEKYKNSKDERIVSAIKKLKEVIIDG